MSTSTPTDTVVRAPRMNLAGRSREQYRAMSAFDRSIAFDEPLRELIKVRSSQINGCAYCLDMHVPSARKAGIPETQLDTLAAWRESPFFSARERAALALTEAVTRLADGPVPDAVYDEAAAQFDEAELAQVIWSIIAINAWNRVAVTTQLVALRATSGS